MSSSGPSLAGTGANDASFGANAWSNAGNITSSNNVRATVAVLGSNSQYLKATNFGFSIPAGAIILGIEFRFERQASAGSASDVRVRAVKGGSIQSTDLSAGAAWNASSDRVDSFGGASSLWGTTWTASDINASDFGVVLACTGTGTAEVDAVDCTVTYTAGGTDQFGQTGFFGL